MIEPSFEAYTSLAAMGGCIPVRAHILADMETPLSAYWKLAHDEEYSFLLESVTGGEQLARYSMIGFGPRHVCRSHPDGMVVDGEERQLKEGQDPLDVVQSLAPKIRPELATELPKLCGGAVGWIGYDYVRRIERIPNRAVDDLGLEDVAMMIMDKAVVFDHVKNQIQIIVLADGTPDGYEEAGREIGAILGKLKQPLPPLPAAPGDAPEFTANMSPSDYEAIVRRCVQYIVAGDAFQIVPSQRFEAPCTAHPLQIYRALRSLNPSPYMYLLRLGDTDVVGASPEILVGQSGDEARVRPIAGTRRRGANPEEDKELAADLLQDKKERAEHIMLVDLGRNDLGRVCEYGSVRVKDLMVIEHYSHVMHIVSEVVGTLRPNVRPSDLVRATFPAGTLSGAPKVRAMEIIEELEPTKRGLYGGCVGYFSAAGDFDLAIAIRTALIRNGVAYVQAGAGIVFDSVPSKEHQECVSKAQAVVKAIQVAHVGLD
jgi:anthranilate synthase component 1